jgi:hypothetical protein
VAWYVATRAAKAAATREKRELEAAHMKELSAKNESENIAADVLHAELERLPEKYKLPLVLHHVEGFTEEETGALLGCPAGTVSMRLSRGRQKLRDLLRKRGVTTPDAGVRAMVKNQAFTNLIPALVVATTHLAMSVHAGGMATASTSPSVQALSKGALNMLLWIKIRMMLMVMVTVMLLGGTGFMVRKFALAADNKPMAQSPAATTPATPLPHSMYTAAPNRFEALGEITKIDGANITVQPVTPAGSTVKPDPITFGVTIDTVVKIDGKRKAVSDLKVGDGVSAILTNDRKVAVEIDAPIAIATKGKR